MAHILLAIMRTPGLQVILLTVYLPFGIFPISSRLKESDF